MDLLSFTLNYEINALIYDEATAKIMETQFMIDLESSSEVTRDDYGRLPGLKQLREGQRAGTEIENKQLNKAKDSGITLLSLK